MTEINEDIRFVCPFHVTTNQIEDELVALNLQTSLYYGVDGIGTQIWRLLIDEKMTVTEACRNLVEEYDVDAGTCQREVLAFVEQLRMHSFWRRWRRRLRSLKRMSLERSGSCSESLTMLAVARAMVKSTRGKRLISRMGPAITDVKPGFEVERDGDTADSGAGVRIGRMVERTARTTWWRSMCLEKKALAGKWMLRRRGIASTMYVGMARQEHGFVAHAWLVGEGKTLTGAGKTRYAALAAFRESDRSDLTSV